MRESDTNAESLERSLRNRRQGGRGAETIVEFSRSRFVTASDLTYGYRAIITPVAADGRIGASVSSDVFMITENCLEPSIPRWQFIPPVRVVEAIAVSIVVDESACSPHEFQVYVNLEIPPRYKLCWVNQNGKIFAEGNSFVPLAEDIGQTFRLQVIDRIKNTVVEDLYLPPVEAHVPMVSDIQLKIKSNPKTKKSIVVVDGKYRGGVQGESVVVWRTIDRSQGKINEINEITRTTERALVIDESIDGRTIDVVYHPVDEKAREGEPIISSPITVPRLPRQSPRKLTGEIAITNNFTTLQCRVRGCGYTWGYEREHEREFIDNHSRTRPLVSRDFIDTPICSVRALDEDNADVICMCRDLTKLFTPTITNFHPDVFPRFCANHLRGWFGWVLR
jgi:hypothetical protein